MVPAVDTWHRDQEVPGSSPGFAGSTLSRRERPFASISQPTLVQNEYWTLGREEFCRYAEWMRLLLC